METQTPKTTDITLENLQVKIEKYPMAESRNLMEYFVIIGYEETYIQEKIIKPISQKNDLDFEQNESKSKKNNTESKTFKEYKCRNLPTILSSISSSFKGGIAIGKKIVEQVFPIPPPVYYAKNDNFAHEFNQTNIIFSNIQNDVVNVGYSLLFYENRTINILNQSKELIQLKIYIPKAFAIISQYPYFNFFHCICKEIFNLYRCNSLEIPIEIQLYNIVNYTPAPIHSNIRLSLFPNLELLEIINKCKNSKDFIELEKQQKYTLNQLSGYRISDINFTEIFSVLSVENIVEVYLELISGHTLGFFSSNIEVLNFTIYIFQQFFSPLAPNESVSASSPTKFFCSENIDQYIVGFYCSYEDIDSKNPFRELKIGEYKWQSEDEEKSDLDPQLFRCDFILDLDKKIFKEPEKNHRAYFEIENYKQVQKLNEYFKKIIYNDSVNNNSFLDSSIKKLLTKLRDLSVKLTSYGYNNKNTLPNFFSNNNNSLLSRSILEAFYQFNLNIANIYYEKVSTYDGNYTTLKMNQDLTIKSKEESGLNDDEYLFFSCFSNSLYCNVLGNMIGGYSENEPKIYKVSKRIFEKILVLKKIGGEMDNSFENFDKYYDLIDYVYEINNTIEDFSFFEFYKYYSNKLEKEVFDFVLNNEFVEGKITKLKTQILKKNFKYKKIDIDNNLLFKYIYFIKSIPKDIRAKCFELENKPKDIKEIIYNKDMSTKLEKFFIDFKLIDYKDVIMLSILGIVALTVSKFTIIHYITPINEILSKLKVSVRKYIEIILSITLRLFYKEKVENYYIYFSIYNTAISHRNIFLNDELIVLETRIQNYIQTITNNNIIKNNTINKPIENKDIKFDFDKKKINDAKACCFNFGKNKIKSKIKLKFKNKSEHFDEIYSIVKVYEEINKMVDSYYKTLDFKSIPKDEFKKLVVFLIYYCTLFEEEMPRDIDKFLCYCLDID